MAEAAVSGSERFEFEIRGGLWESVHVVVFYASVVSAVLATAGVLRLELGISCIVILFYSMFTIFSSPTYAICDAGTRQLILERYHYFIPSRKAMEREELEGLEVVESQRVPDEGGERATRHDLAYFVRVYLLRKGGRRLKLYGSGMTGAPADNRAKAFLIAQHLAGELDIPVKYARRGRGEDHAAGRPGE
ncbi:MAG: hypothetical protein AB1384_07690 [Actinomycetota bacterium]